MVVFSTKTYLTLTPLVEVRVALKVFTDLAANIGGEFSLILRGVATDEEVTPKVVLLQNFTVYFCRIFSVIYTNTTD